MKAGILKETIEIYRPETIEGEYRDKIEYTLFKQIRANVRYDSGSRSVENSEIVYSTYRTFIVRHYQDIAEEDRIKYDGKFYRILSIAPDKYFNDKVIVAEKINE